MYHIYVCTFSHTTQATIKQARDFIANYTPAEPTASDLKRYAGYMEDFNLTEEEVKHVAIGDIALQEFERLVEDAEGILFKVENLTCTLGTSGE